MRLFVKTPSGRHRYNVLGALDYQTKELVRVCNTGYVNAQTVCQLLHKLRQMYPEQKIKMFLDNARYQRCRLVQDVAEELGIELEFLPSYSPNLNRIERVWKFVKKECLAGKYYENFEDFQTGIDECLDGLSGKYKNQIDSLITRNFQLFDNQTFLTV